MNKLSCSADRPLTWADLLQRGDWAGLMDAVECPGPPDAPVDAASLAALLFARAIALRLPAFADLPMDDNRPLRWCSLAGLLPQDTAPDQRMTAAGAAAALDRFAALTPSPVSAFLAAHPDGWFLTGKQPYTVHGMIPAQALSVHNFLEDASYLCAADGGSVVLRGTLGEYWVSALRSVLATYTLADGQPLTTDAFSRRGEFIPLRTAPRPNASFARLIPPQLALAIRTDAGDVLYANRVGVLHSSGDYLVCPNRNGAPDLACLWVVNGSLFPHTYTLQD